MTKESRMIELNQKERALLVTVDVFSRKEPKGLKVQDEQDELRELAKTSGVEAVDEVVSHCARPSSNLFIGKGKVDEISAACGQLRADAAIFSVDLSGTQQRNLEETIGCKVIDRTQLILDIFAQHAKSPEGKMQVELAQLEYLLPRLTGKGIMLSRLGGGIGTRGPGEQKLEVDRRRIRSRIAKLKRELTKSSTQRSLARKKRQEEKVPLVSLVGYTNAGKTTLLNSLVNEHQLADDSLFTTLDPLSRTLILPNHQKIVISDTVGFLYNLPVHLIEAFKATLEDVLQADILIHVLDVSHPLRYNYFQAVTEVLRELDCENKPIITALNKIDRLEDKSWLERYKIDFPDSIAISALKKENLEGLITTITARISQGRETVELIIPLEKMSLVDLVHREGKVEETEYTSSAVKLRVNLPLITINKLRCYVNKKNNN